MLDYNEIKPRKYIVFNDEPYEVIENQVARKSQGKPSNQTKLRHLKTGKVVAQNFHVSDSVEEADIERRDITFLYKKGVEIWFCIAEKPSERFTIPLDLIKYELQFLKEKDTVSGIYFNEDELIGIKIPIKVTLSVTGAPPAVKGNTATGASKKITLENGLEITAPLFISEGDKVVVNTEKKEYVERG